MVSACQHPKTCTISEVPVSSSLSSRPAFISSFRTRQRFWSYESARCDNVGMPDETKSRAGSFGAKIAQAAAGRTSRNTASRQRRGRRVNNRKSFSFSSQAFAGMRITHRYQKEAQPEGQHDDFRLEVLLVALVSGRDGCAFRERRLRWIKNNKRLVAPSCKVPLCTYVFEMGATATL
jgi:hypothetical protein